MGRNKLPKFKFVASRAKILRKQCSENYRNWYVSSILICQIDTEVYHCGRQRYTTVAVKRFSVTGDNDVKNMLNDQPCSLNLEFDKH